MCSKRRGALVPLTDDGILRTPSRFSFPETVERLKAAFSAKGLRLFAEIDFSGDAANAGLTMNPTRLLVVGNPRAGTPLMVAVPTVAIDFPLKVLVSQDEAGKVWVSYNAPEYLEARHGIPPGLVKNISGLGTVVQSALI